MDKVVTSIYERDFKHLLSYLDGRYVRMYPAARLFVAWDGYETFDVYNLSHFFNFETFGVDTIPASTDAADLIMDEWVAYYMGKR